MENIYGGIGELPKGKRQDFKRKSRLFRKLCNTSSLLVTVPDSYSARFTAISLLMKFMQSFLQLRKVVVMNKWQLPDSGL